MSRAVPKQAGVPAVGARGRRDPFLWGRVPARPQVHRLKADASYLGPHGPSKIRIKSGSVGCAEKRPVEQRVYSEVHRAAGKVERQVQLWLQELPSMEMA